MPLILRLFAVAKPQCVTRFLHFYAIMVVPVGSFQGLLGHFTSAQMNLIEEPFQSAGKPVPWTSVIIPLRARLQLRVEVAWDRMKPTSFAAITITPRFSLLSSPSESIPTMTDIMVLARDPTAAPARLTRTAGVLGSNFYDGPADLQYGKNPLRALRELLAESLLQPTVSLERPTACRSDLMPKEPLESLPACPLTAETLKKVPASPLTEKSLEKVLVSPLTAEPL